MKKEDIILIILAALLVAAAVITILFGGDDSLHGYGILVFQPIRSSTLWHGEPTGPYLKNARKGKINHVWHDR